MVKIATNTVVDRDEMGDEFNDARLQVYGEAEIIDGEHPDWNEYRLAMVRQGKVLIRITPTRWGPVATGGFPARLAPS